jgi:hypothetical protein
MFAMSGLAPIAAVMQCHDQSKSRFGGLEIDDELDFRGLQDRQIARLLIL